MQRAKHCHVLGFVVVASEAVGFNLQQRAAEAARLLPGPPERDRRAVGGEICV